jgi:hypothetical protein
MTIYGVKNVAAHYNGKKHLKNLQDNQVIYYLITTLLRSWSIFGLLRLQFVKNSAQFRPVSAHVPTFTPINLRKNLIVSFSL